MGEFEVKFSGFQGIGETEKELIKDNCNKFYDRYNKKLKNIEFIELKLKSYQAEGTRTKFSVHSILGFSGTVLTSKAFDWVLLKAVDSSLKKIGTEVSRKFIGPIQRKTKAKTRILDKKLES